MASRIEHRAEFAAPAAAVHAAFVDRDFLAERLRVLGGKGAQLLDYTERGGEVAFKLRQGVDAAKLPSAARAIIKGDLVVERTESWRQAATGFAGDTGASVSGVPGDVKGRFALVDAGTGSVWTTSGEVKVRIPLVGGKIEAAIAEQVGALLAAEARFTADWLARG
ncbi:DUF2505 domain-containing protein [Actinokineospora bangkokensis]|uniref:DUF2505 domain-containing protein n=1 Tax=Actinokineospora bangkokensis TaxID=1193682 RepID=A0A1Q9LFI5_9PSEU|nr:DUF2505 domain-containing protein [Actinokineospora bangkokensis]OLR90765.1 hypothetical protein BJP25_29710 [Actinokineospora bangkokensis]